MRSRWRVFTNANKPEKALQRIHKLTMEFDLDSIDPEAVPYHQGGYVVSFQIEHDAVSWAEIVLEVLTLVQLRSRKITLSGAIQEELDVFADCTVPGITHVHCNCIRTDETQY